MNRTSLAGHVLLAIAMPSTASALPKDLADSLKTYNATSVELTGNVVRIHAARPVVKIAAMRNNLRFAYCFPVQMNGDKAWGGMDLAGIQLLNESGKQGYALSMNKADCKAYASLQSAEQVQFLDARTQVCVAGNLCRPRRPGQRTAADD